MPNDASSPSGRQQELDAIVTAYLKAVEAGANPKPEEWLRRSPAWADELKSFFAAQDQVAGLAGSWPRQPEARLDLATTGLEGADPEGPVATIRYVGDYEL